MLTCTNKYKNTYKSLSKYHNCAFNQIPEPISPNIGSHVIFFDW